MLLRCHADALTGEGGPVGEPLSDVPGEFAGG
jgi:hypothetical protein